MLKIKRIICILCLFVFIFSMVPILASAGYSPAYELYIDLGKKAIENKDYDNAIDYFHQAYRINPESEDPLVYINLIKRLSDGRVKLLGAKKSDHEVVEYIPIKKVKEPSNTKDQIVNKELDLIESKISFKKQKVSEKEKEVIIRPEKLAPILGKGEVYLNDKLWASQPRSLIRVELNSAVILEGNNIKRFLVITPGFIDVERVNKDRIKIIANKRGATYLHIWDDRGRWTLNVEIIYKFSKAKAIVKEREVEYNARPFTLSYASDWSSFYSGTDIPSMERESLNYQQKISIDGEVPIGDLDSYVIFNKFDESTEATGYSIGLGNGHIGNFKDFYIRGYDAQKEFSELSFPGQYFRGILFESRAFNNRLAYTYLHGKDRAIYGFITPGIVEVKESFIEGGKITLFPDEEDNISFNFARGYGEARDASLKDRVYSIEAQKRLYNYFFTGEIAYDEDEIAQNIFAQYRKGINKINLELRNINKDFSTITGRPGNRGEVGGIIDYETEWKDININATLDLYRDRYNQNLNDPNVINYDFDASIDVPIKKNERWRSSIYYNYTPQEISPRKNLRLNSNYINRFKLFDKNASTHIGGSYQRSRYDFSPASEYDRYSLSTGFNYSLYKNLDYFLNVQYSIVDEIESGETYTPMVFYTGLNYSKDITNFLIGNIGLYYRNEEQSGGSNSFLSGEDSISLNLGLNYRPSPDYEFFVDGRLRDVTSEAEGEDDYNEFDIRWGMRLSWESPFHWNPKGIIEGIVFKDENSNKIKDPDEEGIPGVKIKIGKKGAVTDSRGYFKSKVKAKKVKVRVDLNSIPKKFVFTTPIFKEIEIIPFKSQKINFGLTTSSGIYGIVYYDKNKNKKPDPEDDFIIKAKMILDDKREAFSDFEGSYFFKDISPGKHNISIDINSLPEEYLPSIKIKNEVDVSEGTTYVFHVPLNKIKNK